MQDAFPLAQSTEGVMIKVSLLDKENWLTSWERCETYPVSAPMTRNVAAA